MSQDEFVNSDILSYCHDYTSEAAEYLDDLNKVTLGMANGANMISGFYQGRLLSLLSKIQKPQRILEIGTFTGYSALCLAEGLDVDGTLITIDNDPEMKPIVEKYVNASPFKTNIKMLIGQALDLIPQLDGKFDLVFIDAAKKQYIDYVKSSIPLLKSGALIIADNVLWKGKVLDDQKDARTQKLHEFNNFIQESDLFDNLMFPIRDGLLLARYR